MPRWLVEIEGKKADMSNLGAWIPSKEVHIVQDDSGAYLVGPVFENLDDTRRVYELAEELWTEISSAAQVMQIIEEPIVLGLIHREHEDGTRSSHGFGGSSLSVGIRVKRSLPVGCDETNLQTLVRETRKSEHLRAAVDALAMKPRSWPRLYRALEEVEAYLGASVSSAGLCTSADRERLKHSANSPEVAGVDSRHRLRKFEAPAKPMPLAEASALLCVLIERAAVKASAGAA